MDDLTTKIGIPGGAGILGMILGWFGLKAKICNVQKEIRELKKNVVFTDVFIEFKDGLNERLDIITTNSTESQKDIKKILEKMPK